MYMNFINWMAKTCRKKKEKILLFCVIDRHRIVVAVPTIPGP
jgi:hypothetical protein